MTVSPEFVERLVGLACRIQQIPAPTFHEAARAEFLYGCFGEIPGISSVERDGVGNILACMAGEKNAPPVVVSAHLDTVFPANTVLSILRTRDAVQAPGIGDNSLGAAALVGLAWLVAEQDIRLPGDLWLAGSVCEEGLGNLRGMQALVERFGGQPAAYIVVEGLGLGEVFNRGLGVRRLRTTFVTGGGHSWIDAGQPSAIHESARLVNRLIDLPLPQNPRTALNVGIFSGGTTVNTIAASAAIEIDMRCEEPGGLESLCWQVEQELASARKKGVQVTWEVTGSRPAGGIPDSHPLVQLALRSLQNQGIEGHTGIGSTDANLPFSRGWPAVTVGLTCGSGAHTAAESLEIAPIAAGMQALRELAGGAFTLDQAMPGPQG